jgi:hypothetical protein
VEASFLKQMGVYGNLSLMTPIFKQFVAGGKMTAEEKKNFDSIQWMTWNNYENGKKSFSDVAHQVLFSS